MNPIDRVRVFFGADPNELQRKRTEDAARKERERAERQRQAEARDQALWEQTISERFDGQLKLLEARGCPAEIVAKLRSRRDKVLTKFYKRMPETTNEPFYPVIPLSVLSVHQQIAMVFYDGLCGFTTLDQAQIVDVRSCPQEPYYIFNVGTMSSSGDRREEDARKGFHGLTVAGLIAVAIHTNCYRIGPAYASRYDGYTPRIILDDDYRPRLTI